MSLVEAPDCPLWSGAGWHGNQPYSWADAAHRCAPPTPRSQRRHPHVCHNGGRSPSSGTDHHSCPRRVVGDSHRPAGNVGEGLGPDLGRRVQVARDQGRRAVPFDSGRALPGSSDDLPAFAEGSAQGHTALCCQVLTGRAEPAELLRCRQLACKPLFQ